MVRLKVFNNKPTLYDYKDFNSNMVRLKEKPSRLGFYKANYFNSNMVRLKAKADYKRNPRKKISIPIWFD